MIVAGHNLRSRGLILPGHGIVGGGGAPVGIEEIFQQDFEVGAVASQSFGLTATGRQEGDTALVFICCEALAAAANLTSQGYGTVFDNLSSSPLLRVYQKPLTLGDTEIVFNQTAGRRQSARVAIYRGASGVFKVGAVASGGTVAATPGALIADKEKSIVFALAGLDDDSSDMIDFTTGWETGFRKTTISGGASGSNCTMGWGQKVTESPGVVAAPTATFSSADAWQAVMFEMQAAGV